MTGSFECPVCLEYMDQKIIICITGHSFCETCGKKLKRICPICKGRLYPERRNIALEKAAKLFKKIGDKKRALVDAVDLTQADDEVVHREVSKKPTAPYWQSACDGNVPHDAFPGGYDNADTLYIARVDFEMSLLIGKLHPRYKCALIPWDGEEHEAIVYEVLCNFNGFWAPCHGGDIPAEAFFAGESENGEPLYVGRVHHLDTLTVGQVHPGHKMLNIVYGGKELAFEDYEILCEM